MRDCCIEGCQTSVKRDVVTFEFPTSRVLRKRWLEAIGPAGAAGGAAAAGGARVCLRHFTPADYEPVRGKLRLKGKVVPSLFGDQALSPTPLKDPLDLPDTQEKEPQENTDNDNHNGKIDNDNEKSNKDNVDIDKETCDNVKEDSNSSSKDAKENGHIESEVKDNGNHEKDNGDIENCNEKTENDDRNNDNERIVNDDTVTTNKRTANKVGRKVKKKWVPMRKRPEGHGSESEDSVNSEDPPPPVLEDLEEHLPNYQIANMKTERQVAAMADTADPPPPDPPEDLMLEPHVPVFIELSVGQDSVQVGDDQRNDCLMVLESVQCDVDPTLMLEARAEDEECCEQIDLDDDDDDLPPPTNTAAIPSSKTSADPISLLTSSDEDDVILQEPHIDTLSVSDETDEDDVPLQKLIKKSKKTKKNKKGIPELQSIMDRVTDFYCYHCQHISASQHEHNRHVKGHVKDDSDQKTRVYQICKECGYTTSGKSQLHRHQRKHLNEKRYKCPLCSYRSKYNMSLMYHLKTHNFDPNMYNCGACGLKLDSKKALLKHQDACYALSAKVSCDKCSFSADNKRILKIHKSTVHK